MFQLEHTRKFMLFIMLLKIETIYPDNCDVQVKLAPDMWDLEYLIGNRFGFDVTLIARMKIRFMFME